MAATGAEPIRPESGLPPPSIVPDVLITTPSVVTTRHRFLPKAIELASSAPAQTSVSRKAGSDVGIWE